MLNIKETFLRLTKQLYPYTQENKLIDILYEFNFTKDYYGNYYIIVKKDNNEYSNTMFTCHLDTYYKNNVIELNDVYHNIDGDFISTDGLSILGADDKAGMTIMLNMISENIPGLYYFFIGEECGRIGSVDLSLTLKNFLIKNNININKCISFDRRGYDKISVCQSNIQTCSYEFASYLSNEFNKFGFWYNPDDNGGKTDSLSFNDIINECTNISVGYFNEHTFNEYQDIDFLELLSNVVLKIEWDNIPIYKELNDNLEQFDNDMDNITCNYFEQWYSSQFKIMKS